MIWRIMEWRRDAHDLRIIREARAISRQAALNALATHIEDRQRRGRWGA